MKLVSSAVDLESWKQSTYGKNIRICDSSTLDDVREVWKSYCVLDISPDQRVENSKCFAESLSRARALRNDRIGDGSDL